MFCEICHWYIDITHDIYNSTNYYSAAMRRELLREYKSIKEATSVYFCGFPFLSLAISTNEHL